MDKVRYFCKFPEENLVTTVECYVAWEDGTETENGCKTKEHGWHADCEAVPLSETRFARLRDREEDEDA